jgi:pantetheine-phosphate adenylyltransferase
MAVPWSRSAGPFRPDRNVSGLSKVLYPGSFDPLHKGHIEIVEIASRLFGEVIVAAMVNREKAGFFPLDERLALIEESLAHVPGVKVTAQEGLVVDAARTLGADFVVKGLRAASDFEIEMQMAQMNKAVTGMETVLIPSGSTLGFLSSRWIREIAAEGGDVSALVPEPVARALKGRYAR